LKIIFHEDPLFGTLLRGGKGVLGELYFKYALSVLKVLNPLNLTVLKTVISEFNTFILAITIPSLSQ
jgi:hypothetical protein